MEARTWSLKIIIIGQPSVGKTSLRRAYLGEKFRINYIATIGADFSYKQIQLVEDIINTSIWDLAGQETFKQIHPQYYRGSAGALVVYDVTSRGSFESIREWIEKYQSLTGEVKCPIMIVGNKIDLKDELVISSEEQESLVEELKNEFDNKFPILSSRTSALTGKDINESFYTLVNEIIQWQHRRLKQPVQESESDLEDNIPSSYLLTFHDAFGPKILIKSPITKSFEDQEFGSTIKIASILDFEDVINNAQVTGNTPWASPSGSLYYIAFTIDNKKARGGKSLFIIGFVAPRELREIISQSQHIIDGYLHATLNEFVRFILENNLDLTSEDSDTMSDEQKTTITNLLSKLRHDVFNAIKKDIL